MQIIPAILQKSFYEIEKEISQIVDVAKFVQVDFCDGVFVLSKTWPYAGVDTDIYKSILNQEAGMPYWEEVDFEFDLMIANPEEKLDDFISLGPKRIVFHLATLSNPKQFFENIDPYVKENIEFGVAITIDDDLKKLKEIINEISFVQCMGIEKVGLQGQPFEPLSVALVKSVHDLYPDILISVDGAVDKENILRLRDAGASRFCVGSAIFSENEDPCEQYREFFDIIKR